MGSREAVMPDNKTADQWNPFDGRSLSSDGTVLLRFKDRAHLKQAVLKNEDD